MPRPVEEVLYPALEDFNLDVVLGKGPTARSIRLELPRFTLVGGHHAAGTPDAAAAGAVRLLAPPRLLLGGGPGQDRDALGRHPRGPRSTATAAAEIARRSRGTPRIANRLLRRVRDFAEVRHDGSITLDVARGRPRGLRGGRPGPRSARPLDPPDADRQVRRGSRRAVDARGLRRGGDRHRRGRRGALPAAARFPPEDAPRDGWPPSTRIATWAPRSPAPCRCRSSEVDSRFPSTEVSMLAILAQTDPGQPHRRVPSAPADGRGVLLPADPPAEPAPTGADADAVRHRGGGRGRHDRPASTAPSRRSTTISAS